jgi:hypothetical protein
LFDSAFTFFREFAFKEKTRKEQKKALCVSNPKGGNWHKVLFQAFCSFFTRGKIQSIKRKD